MSILKEKPWQKHTGTPNSSEHLSRENPNNFHKQELQYSETVFALQEYPRGKKSYAFSINIFGNILQKPTENRGIQHIPILLRQGSLIKVQTRIIVFSVILHSDIRTSEGQVCSF
jgi:hypothetical protein